MSEHTIEKLFTIIQERERMTPDNSYTARLLSSNIQHIAKKVGEEAVETAIAAVSGEKKLVISESSDLIYHLLVLWRAAGVTTSDVWEELEKRFEKSGIEEKASRNIS